MLSTPQLFLRLSRYLNISLYKVVPKIVLHFFTIYFNLKTFVKLVHYRNPERNSTSLFTKLKLDVENLRLPVDTGERNTLGDWYWHIHTSIHKTVGNGNPLQYSCLENPMDREAWWAIVHSLAKSQTWLKWLSIHKPDKKNCCIAQRTLLNTL